jgi:alkaline phosphatase D
MGEHLDEALAATKGLDQVALADRAPEARDSTRDQPGRVAPGLLGPTTHRVTTRFGEVELERMVAVGAVGPGRARLWVRAPRPGDHELVIGPRGGACRRLRVTVPAGEADHTAAFTYPDDFPGEPSLAPATLHDVRIGALGAGSFVTAPTSEAPPAPLRLALLSCHEPYDSQGVVHERAHRMLRIAAEVLRAPDVAFAVFAGDQVYSDYPPSHSLFTAAGFGPVAPLGRASILECSRAEVRAIYHRRYRCFWAFPEWRRLQAGLATYPILDDHEIVDNWGSLTEHSDPRWANLRDGALDAFHDYQAARVLPRRPPAFDHAFRWGRAGVYVCDVRSQRRARRGETIILGDGQHERLAAFLASTAGLDSVLLVIGVPILHLGEWPATLLGEIYGDAADRWSFAPALPERDRLLRLLHAHTRAHPRQRVILLGGDIHVGCAMKLVWEDGAPPVLQLVSSAISNVASPLVRVPAAAAPQLLGAVRGDGVALRAELVPPTRAHHEHPYPGLNFGLIDLEPAGAAPARVRFRLIGDDQAEAPGPRTVYDTGWV